MMQEEEKRLYDSDSMSICSDENTTFQLVTIRRSQNFCTKISFTLLILGNFFLCALYINLHVQYAKLQHQFNNAQPELFPCK